ncbi:hypothetical protein H5T87_08145 [bacterium]|nr:hypothetical protein [bacterium]
MKTKLTSLIIYSSGFGYFVREGEGQLEKGYVSLDYLPQASSGSFWIYIKQKNAYPETIINPQENTIDFKDKAELLASLQGKIGEKLKIELTEGGTVEGKLSHVLPDLILLERDKGEVSAINPEKVKKAVLLGYPLKLKVGGMGENDKVGIVMSYLQSGPSWEPNYLLYLTNDKEAMLSLRATVVNNLEDWDNITCYFAIGMPRFPLKTIIDPLITRSLMVYTDGAMRVIQGEKATTITNEEAGAYGGYGGYGGYTPPPVSLAGEELSALYLYKKEGFSLKKGDAGSVTISNISLPYKHLYSWDVNRGLITHLLTFTNKTEVPLVPGSILVVEESNPLGQDYLNLVPVGGEGRITLGIATELEGKAEETEISREFIETKEKEPKTYAKLTIRGRLELTNRGRKEAEVETIKTVAGEIISSTPQAKVILLSSGGLNPVNKLTWNVKIPPGGKIELKYEFTTFQQAPSLPPTRPATTTESSEGTIEQ